MGYVRKTRDVWCIETNYGYGWETESEYRDDDYEGRPGYENYNPYKAAKEDLKEYKLDVCSHGGSCRLVKRREKIA